MKIRMKTTVRDYPESYRPLKNKIYDVIETVRGAYHPRDNFLYHLMIKGHRVAVFPHECEVIR